MFFLLIKKKTEIKEDKTEQVFKDEINALRNTFSQSFGSMSKDIAKDMTGALTRVDEKVGIFNKQVEVLNKSQENFSRILAGVKQYGVLAEFSLASLLKDLLPASKFIENVKWLGNKLTNEVKLKRPTRLVCYNKNYSKILNEINLEELGINWIFSILKY